MPHTTKPHLINRYSKKGFRDAYCENIQDIMNILENMCNHRGYIIHQKPAMEQDLFNCIYKNSDKKPYS